MMTRAFLDLGTNAATMVVFLVEDNHPPSVLLEAERTTRLGLGTLETRRIPPDSLVSTLAVVDELVDEARVFNPGIVEAVGTTALRIAVNREELTEPIFARHGVRVRLLTVTEESNASFFAVRSVFPNGPIAALDLGGGSVDITIGAGKRADRTISLPFGSRSLVTAVPLSDPPTADELSALRRYVRTVAGDLKPLPRNHQLVLHGGAATILAGYARTMMGAPGNRVAEVLYSETLEGLVRLFSRYTIRERRDLPGSNPEKAEILVCIAVAMSELFRLLEARQAKVSTVGIAHGMLESELRDLPLDPEVPQIVLPRVDFRPLIRSDRRGEVLFLLRRNDGRIWLQTKEPYPDGVYRIPGGGIDGSESPREAVLREVREETGVVCEHAVPLLKLAYTLPDSSAVDFSTTIYLFDIGDREPVSMDASEGISGWVAASCAELEEHAARLETVEGERHAWGLFRAAAIRQVIRLGERGTW